MHPIIETHGKQLISELLDIIFINEGSLTNKQAREFLIKHKVVTKATKFTSVMYRKENVSHEYIRRDGYYGTQRIPLEVPYIIHRIHFKNGSGVTKLSIQIRSTELSQIMEELRSETNETI